MQKSTKNKIWFIVTIVVSIFLIAKGFWVIAIQLFVITFILMFIKGVGEMNKPRDDDY